MPVRKLTKRSRRRADMPGGQGSRGLCGDDALSGFGVAVLSVGRRKSIVRAIPADGGGRVAPVDHRRASDASTPDEARPSLPEIEISAPLKARRHDPIRRTPNSDRAVRTCQEA